MVVWLETLLNLHSFVADGCDPESNSENAATRPAA